MVARLARSRFIRAAIRLARRHPLACILLLAAGLRLIVIGTQSMWYDEIFTNIVSQLPMDRLLEATAGDVHPPTWYLIERAFIIVLGDGEFAMRLPAMLLGLLCVWLTWRMMGLLGLKNLAAPASLLMAVAPTELYYSNEARMYMLMAAAMLVATLGALGRKPWLLAGGVAVLLFSHNLSVIYMPTLVVTTLVVSKRAKSLLPIAIGCLPWLAWLPQLAQQANDISNLGNGGYWIERVTHNYVASLVVRLNSVVFPDFSPDVFNIVAIPIVLAFLIWPAWAAVTRRSLAALLLAGLALGPALTMLAVSYLWKPILITRGLIGILPPWFGLTVWWIKLPHEWTWARHLLIGLSALVFFSTSVVYFTHDRTYGMHETVRYIRTVAQPGDLVCHADLATWGMFQVYYPGPSRLAWSKHDLSHTFSQRTVDAIGIPQGDLDDDCDWLIFGRDPLSGADVIEQAERAAQRGTLVHQVRCNRATFVNVWKMGGLTKKVNPLDFGDKGG